MDGPRVESAPDEGRDDLLALLDEELDRLPARHRDPLVLCELEGMSRRDAARRLGLPEGTLSSRLSRGRSLLRDRLARRGVALGTGTLAATLTAPAGAALPEPLAVATVGLALKFAAGGSAAGTVPATIGTLANRVLSMIFVAKLKQMVVATFAAGAAACLTAGLARAVVSERDEPPAGARPPAAIAGADDEAIAKTPAPRPQVRVRGVVVDEAGRPVAGAEVLADAFTDREARGVTGADGSFTLPIRRRQLGGTALLARSAEGGRLGVYGYDFNLSKTTAEAPARIVLKPAREVVVRVADAGRAPVPGAAVLAAGGYRTLDEEATGPDGSARLRVPADAKVEWIIALKSGRGFDYAEYGPIDEQGRSQGGAPAADLPASVALTLDGVRVARIKAVDEGGKPLAGVGFAPWLLHKEGRRSQVNHQARSYIATTGPDGVATFDWLPPEKDLLQFWPIPDGYARRRVLVEEGQTAPVTARLIRTETIRGRVVRPDGSPAPDIEVHARGTGRGMDQGQARTRTAADGSYEMEVSPNEAYAVYVEDKDWAAPARLDVIVREGKPADAVDFRLARGTVLRGTVTVGLDNRPAPGQYIRLNEDGPPAPKDLLVEGDHAARQVMRQFGALTDAEGRYAVRVGPGTYRVTGPPRTGDETITITDQAELVRDYRMPRPEKETLTGRVVLAGDPDQGVARAKVEVVARGGVMSLPFAVTADAGGRFRCERELDPLVICAHSPDGKFGAIVEGGAEDPAVIIAVAPTATATGRLLDEEGRPAANQKLYWGRRIVLDEEKGISMIGFAPKVVTDAEGRFTLPALVVGQEYSIGVERGNSLPTAGVVRPERAGAIDLGTLRVGAYRRPATASKRP